MANTILTGILGAIAPMLEAAGEGFLVTTLQGVHDKNLDEYKNDIPVLHAILKRVKVITDASVTKIDDVFVNAFIEAVEASAAANGVVLL